MIQAALIFLVVIAVLGVGGKWLRRAPPRGRGGPAIEAAARCPACRSYVVGRTPAPCARTDCPYAAGRA